MKFIEEFDARSKWPKCASISEVYLIIKHKLILI